MQGSIGNGISIHINMNIFSRMACLERPLWQVTRGLRLVSGLTNQSFTDSVPGEHDPQQAKMNSERLPPQTQSHGPRPKSHSTTFTSLRPSSYETAPKQTDTQVKATKLRPTTGWT